MAPKPFSGRQKKLQLQERKERNTKASHLESLWESKPIITSDTKKPHEFLEYQEALPSVTSPLKINLKEFLRDNSLALPQRPPWSSKDSLKELEKRENEYFTSYLANLEGIIDADVLYERNIEVWRQLWRVIEKSDILVIVCDARYPIIPFSLLYPPKGKKVVLSLMKCDLVDETFISDWKSAWMNLFKELDLSIPIVCLESSSSFQRISTNAPPKKYCKEDSKALISCLMDMDDSPFRKEEWKTILNDENSFSSLGENLLTIGIIGSPNAGKSSLINCLFGKKVVSSSRTPGHTKHLQTMHLSNSIRLCDSPGIIFPFKGIKRPLQVLMGIYNIAQLRDPFSVLQLYSSHYNIPFPPNISKKSIISLMDLLEELAISRGFFTTKGKADIHRISSLLIRQIISGELEFTIGVSE